MRQTTRWALLLACCASAAHANRPLNTDTADVIEAGQCQFEPYAAITGPHGGPDARLSLLQLNCGVAGTSQFGAALARMREDDQTGHLATVGGKTNLVPLDAGWAGLAVNYSLGWARGGGRSASLDTLAASLIATRNLAPGLLLHANLGHQHSRAQAQDSSTWGLATEWSVRDNVTLSLEGYGDDRSRPWLSAGALWAPRPGFSVNASYGVQSARSRQRQLSAGLLLQF